jgi:hypothetical protein
MEAGKVEGDEGREVLEEGIELEKNSTIEKSSEIAEVDRRKPPGFVNVLDN